MLQEQIANAALSVIKFIFYAFLWQVILLNLGRITLLLLTLGRYPRGRLVQLHENRICIIGVLALLAAWSALAIYNHLHPWQTYG